MTEKPLAEVIAELRKLHEAATPAPWDVAGEHICGPDGETIAYWEDRDDDAPGANLQLAIDARNALPRLLALWDQVVVYAGDLPMVRVTQSTIDRAKRDRAASAMLAALEKLVDRVRRTGADDRVGLVDAQGAIALARAAGIEPPG